MLSPAHAELCPIFSEPTFNVEYEQLPSERDDEHKPKAVLTRKVYDSAQLAATAEIAAIMNGVGYAIPVCLYHFVLRLVIQQLQAISVCFLVVAQLSRLTPPATGLSADFCLSGVT